MYANQKLYRSLSQHNTFIVNGDFCSGGAYSALMDKPPEKETDPIRFTYGNFGFVDDNTKAECPAPYPPKTAADYLCWCTPGYIVKYNTIYGRDYIDYHILYNNGRKSLIRGYTKRLSPKVQLPSKFDVSNLVRKMLVDTELSGANVTDSGELIQFIVLDLDRIDKDYSQEKSQYYQYIMDSLIGNTISAGRIYPVVVYDPNKHTAVLGIRNVDTYETITGSLHINEELILPLISSQKQSIL